MGGKETCLKKSPTVLLSLLGLFLFFFLAFLFLRVPESVAQKSAILPGAPGSFSELVKKTQGSVVNIYTVKVIKNRIPQLQFRNPFGQNDPFYDFFERFFRDQIPKEYRQRSLGSGFIIDKDGYILTNNHVVEKTDEIKVLLENEKEFDATIVGRDPKTDLALIRIETNESLNPLPLGDSDKLEVGDWVIAIGNPFGLEHTVTAGIVSAKYRRIGAGSYDNFIQTDASINPGNSGGPLLNMNGEVVGINSMIVPGGGGSIGIGFAIPINMAKDLLPQLKEGRVIRGWIGVLIQHITSELKEKFKLKDEKGALVADVTPGGPAEKAGIKRGDVVISFDGREIHEMSDLPLIVASTPVDKTVVVEIIRDGKKISVKVTVEELKEEKEEEDRVEEKKNLGMIVEEITPEIARRFGLSENSGLVVVEVENNSPAEEATIRRGDIILEVDQKPIKTLQDYQEKIQQYQKGDTILFLVKRMDSTIYLTLNVWE